MSSPGEYSRSIDTFTPYKLLTGSNLSENVVRPLVLKKKTRKVKEKRKIEKKKIKKLKKSVQGAGPPPVSPTGVTGDGSRYNKDQ